MSSLRNLQDDLFYGLITNNLSLKHIKENGDIDIVDRLQVHRDTILENFVSALKITYPGIWRLIGEDCARGAALAYSHDINNIRKQSKMNDFGDQFPEFIKNFASTRHLKYLSDYAKLEWLKYKSYKSKDEKSLSTEEIQSFFTNGCENGKFILNSSVCFLKSEFPLMQIQELLDNPEIKNLNLENSSSYIVICRVNNNIDTLYISENQWNFLYSLHNGNSILQAMDNFTNAEIENQLSFMTKLLLSKEMIKQITEEI